MSIKTVAVALTLVALGQTPSFAQVELPNGQTTGADLVQLQVCYGQDSGDGSGVVLASAQPTPAGAINLYVYTGNAPSNYIWCRVPLDPNIVPPTEAQPRCQVTTSQIYEDETFLFGYQNFGEWPFPSMATIDGSSIINGQRNVNVWIEMDNWMNPWTGNILRPWTAYVIDLLCPPVR